MQLVRCQHQLLLTIKLLLQTRLQRCQRPCSELVYRLVSFDEVSEGWAQTGQFLRGVFSAQGVETLPGGVNTALLILKIFLEILWNISMVQVSLLATSNQQSIYWLLVVKSVGLIIHMHVPSPCRFPQDRIQWGKNLKSLPRFLAMQTFARCSLRAVSFGRWSLWGNPWPAHGASELRWPFCGGHSPRPGEHGEND